MSSAHINIRYRSGAIQVKMDDLERQAILGLVKEYSEFNDPNHPDAKRLFPAAYKDHPELEQGYQALATEGLMDSKAEAIQVLEDTIYLETITPDQAETWLKVINDIRLVLGTQLDVSEDDPLDDFSDERVALYHALSLVCELLVKALTKTL